MAKALALRSCCSRIGFVCLSAVVRGGFVVGLFEVRMVLVRVGVGRLTCMLCGTPGGWSAE